MPRLEILRLGLKSRRHRASRPPLQLTRSVLPALTKLVFDGVHGYLDDLLAQIEAPLLKYLDVAFYTDVGFVLPQLHRFISHAESFKTRDRAKVRASARASQLVIYRGEHWILSLQIRCRELDSQLPSLAKVCSSFPLLSTLVRLEIVEYAPRPQWRDDMEVTQGLELLDPFTAVNDLCLSDQVARRVCQALEELAEERVTDVLPALQNIFLKDLEPSESVPKYIEKFFAARNLSGHPVAVHRWDRTR
ncbi:hypothetical protein F5148DRAFT_1150308 [Russula earlei]|uniref:Uncharacterized protein n=1 Tax=Russula earlei TaxID=71964 RepID=A0ACC0U6C8_9AGAM|nr:hypothetical protein F5148DRAFT_1150308 [Russula earlei]